MRSKPCFSLDRASADTPTLLGEGSFRYVLRADLQARLLLRRLAFFSAFKSRPRERPFCLVQLREPFLAQQPPPTRGLPSAADAKTSPGRPCPLPNYILALSCTNTAHEHIFFGMDLSPPFNISGPSGLHFRNNNTTYGLRPLRPFDPHFFREGRWAAAPMHHLEHPCSSSSFACL